MKLDVNTIFEELTSRFDRYGIRSEIYGNDQNTKIRSE